MGKISRDGAEVKKIARGGFVVKKVSFGLTELWSDEPWPSSPKFFDDFNSYAANGELDQQNPKWIDQVYASGGYMTVANGMVGANATDRAMNAEIWNESAGSQNQWAAVKVGTLPAANDTAAWTGVALRHTGTGGGVLGTFTGAAFQIRSGTTSTTSGGTLRAEATFASLPSIPNPAVGDWFGMIVTAVDASNAKYELWLRDALVLSWTGNSTFTGDFMGFASSGATAGRIDEWKAGVF